MNPGRSTPDTSDQDASGRGGPRRLEARYRRAPRFRAFITLGVILGVIGAAVLTFSQPPSSDYGYGQVLGYTMVAGALVGGLLGGLVAVLIDWRR